MTRDDLREKIARAIYDHDPQLGDGLPIPFDDFPAEDQDWWRETADAVLAAIAEAGMAVVPREADAEGGTMTERRYTVKEIDALRGVLDMKYLFGSYAPCFDGNGGMSRSFRPGEKAAEVEEQVRTYMLAGITAEDLVADERQQGDEFRRTMRQHQNRAEIAAIIARNIEGAADLARAPEDANV